jgi:anti-sigma B factor antagonist
MTSPGARRPPEPFRTELVPHRQTIMVSAWGEIDLDTAGRLDQQLREVLDSGFKRVVLDLRNVSFLDSTGLRTVIRVHSASRDAGVEFALVSGPAPVQRLFSLTGTDDTLRFIDATDVDRPWS